MQVVAPTEPQLTEKARAAWASSQHRSSLPKRVPSEQEGLQQQQQGWVPLQLRSPEDPGPPLEHQQQERAESPTCSRPAHNTGVQLSTYQQKLQVLETAAAAAVAQWQGSLAYPAAEVPERSSGHSGPRHRHAMGMAATAYDDFTVLLAARQPEWWVSYLSCASCSSVLA